jgi:uncharacterized protein with PIN domain/sulfur carrier protein ThiS
VDRPAVQEVPRGGEAPLIDAATAGGERWIWLRLYAELNEYFPRDKRFHTVRVPLPEGAGVTDLLRAAGVPETEVDLVLVNGTSVPPGHRLNPGDRLAVYPVFDSLDISALQRIRERPLRDPRFVLDVHLGTLARHLRMLGFDTLYSNRATDEELVGLSLGEERVLLSRDRALVSRPELRRAFHIAPQQPLLQLTAIVRRLDLAGSMKPFSRCLRCNTQLTEVRKSEIEGQLPPRVRELFDEFRRCGGCGRVYWRGSHYERMAQLVLHLRAK